MMSWRDRVEQLKEQRDQAERQRDALLVACEFAVHTIENTDMSDNEYAHCLVSVCDKCIAAIAKAKGE